ncbi:hypothetical protein AC579_8245 [Pseudocercospora musae]|uniref:Uncharacterized protein n=1 Tax=Pseudocercospora musae TaxID=113226 RepID=A0A139IVR3_9PEZI|nr:hypothetical protein AC579_8245 [Pseudocercospora musae]
MRTADEHGDDGDDDGDVADGSSEAPTYHAVQQPPGVTSHGPVTHPTLTPFTLVFGTLESSCGDCAAIAQYYRGSTYWEMSEPTQNSDDGKAETETIGEFGKHLSARQERNVTKLGSTRLGAP